jgi:hypothetical protein
MANKNNWIQGAVAQLASKDTKKGSKASAKTKKQAVLTKTLAGLRKKK